MILPYDPVRNNILEGPAAKRRDTWASKEEAMKAFQSRPSWQVWDPRVLKTYVESGLRPLPTAYYPDQTEGVTLKCPRLSESAQYRDKITTTRAYNFLSTITERLPIHILYGAVDDYVPRFIKDKVINHAGGVQKFASFHRVPGAGHLVTQTHTTELAKAIHEVLLRPLGATSVTTRL
ncbi:hypothetical protein HGRIS_012521 [Hohenbuehelia grisea]